MFALTFWMFRCVSIVQGALQPDLHFPPTRDTYLTDGALAGIDQNDFGSSIYARSMPESTEVGSNISEDIVWYWRGWPNIQNIFAFGDSYTSTNFSSSGPQPNAQNPIGNPMYPGATSSDGPNYIDFLATGYNESFVQTYNLAYGGATIDQAIVDSPFGPNVKSFVDQVKEFLAAYLVAQRMAVHWSSYDSLFIIFFGINDAISTYIRSNSDALQYAQIKSYEKLVNQLYETGARNFLIMNVPPIDRSPGSLLLNTSARAAEAEWVARFNFRLNALVENLVRRYPDTTVFQFNTNDIFTSVLDNPKQFKLTRRYLDTTSYCPAYMEWAESQNDQDPQTREDLSASSIKATMNVLDSACPFEIDQYFWLNTLHPTYSMHQLLALQIVRLLKT